MKGKDLLKAVGNIDEKFVDEASHKEEYITSKRKTSVISTCIFAAIICIAIMTDRFLYLPGEIIDESKCYLEELSIDGEISEGSMLFDKCFTYRDLDTLIESSEFIFYGHIKSWDSFVSGEAGTILTNYEFYIDEVLYGEANENNFILREAGGIVSREEYFSVVDEESLRKDFIPESVYEEQKSIKWYGMSFNGKYDVLPLDKDFIIFCFSITESN